MENNEQITQPKSKLGSFASPFTLHVVAEIIVLCAVIGYFSNKISTLSKHIEDIAKKQEEVDERLDKHEQALLNLLSNVQPKFTPAPAPKPPTPPKAVPTPLPVPSISEVDEENLDEELKEELGELKK